MQLRQTQLRPGSDWHHALTPLQAIDPRLVLLFGDTTFFSDGRAARLAAAFPAACVIGCSTAGDISTRGVHDGGAVVTAVRFGTTRVLPASTSVAGMADSRAAGERIGRSLAVPELRAVLLFAPGVDINGSALIDGVTAALGTTAPVTGGLAGDNGAFAQTWTVGEQGVSQRGVVAVGLAGPQLQVGHGSYGGWRAFGPARCVTRCTDNILHQLDGEPALAVYKRYLGGYARGLPASGLLFPFEMVDDDLSAAGPIRTILGVDEARGSLVLAGAVRQGGYLRLMQASTDALVNGAETAAEQALAMNRPDTASLALLVSCVGRRLVMGDRVEEEIDAVRATLGPQALTAGFYAHGEASPFAPGAACRLHNQTMTITTLSEHPCSP